MTLIVGHAAAQAAFVAALSRRAMHHAWLLAGPEGVGKATFARVAAARLLAGAAGEAAHGMVAAESGRTAAMLAAGSHPDFRVLERLQKDAEKPDLARSITIAQVRALQPMFATTPSIGPGRVVVIDAIDDLERAGANALLKNLEEPPSGTVFLLVSHAPGRLLPTIRSRCRLLRFEPLAPAEMRTILHDQMPETEGDEIAELVAAGEGAPGRALRYAGLDIAGIDAALTAFAAGDASNVHRLRLAKALGPKAAQPRYELFLDRAPSFIAAQARTRQGGALRAALDAQSAARDLAGAAIGLSLDAQATVIEMAGLVARLHQR